MDKMKLGIVTTTFFGEECSSGITNTVRLLSKELVKYGVDISVYTPMHKELTKKHGMYRKLPKREKIDDIFVHRIAKIMNEYKFSPGLFTALLKERFDIIHSFHYGYFPATAGFMIAKLKKIPYALTTSYHPSQLTIIKSFLMRLYNVSQGRFILKESDMVFPQNYSETKELRKITNFDYEIVPCPVNDEIFYPRKIKKDKLIVERFDIGKKVK